MAVYAIPNLPVYSPLAGIADLYKEYKGIERQQAQDAYAKERDNREFGLKDRELADSARRTQSTIDYYNGELALKRDLNSAPNQIAMMTARANQKVADANVLKATTEANKLNGEMKWMNSALANIGGNGQPGAQAPLDPEVASLYQNLAKLRAYLGGQ
jgi:hypothetical protein